MFLINSSKNVSFPKINACCWSFDIIFQLFFFIWWNLFVFGNQRCYFRECIWKTHTDHRNFHDCCSCNHFGTVSLLDLTKHSWHSGQLHLYNLQGSNEHENPLSGIYGHPSFAKLSNSSFFTDLQIEISSSKTSEPSDATLSRPAKLFLCDAGQLLRMFHRVLSLSCNLLCHMQKCKA